MGEKRRGGEGMGKREKEGKFRSHSSFQKSAPAGQWQGRGSRWQKTGLTGRTTMVTRTDESMK